MVAMARPLTGPAVSEGAIPGPRGTVLRPIRCDDGRLAAILHAPADRPPDRAGVIAPPLFYERQLCHRTLRALADRLAASGALALRFDYTGTGDSAGDLDDADPARWAADLAAAWARVREDAGPVSGFILGLRAGAFLAMRAVGSGAFGSVGPRLIAWSPVLDGREWVETLDRAHERWYRRYRAQHRRHADTGSAMGRVLGRPFPSELRRAMLEPMPEPKGRAPVLLVQTEGHELARDRFASLSRIASGLEVLSVPPPAPWDEDPGAVAPPVPAAAVRRIAAAVSEGVS